MTAPRKFKSGLANCVWFIATGRADGYAPKRPPTKRPGNWDEFIERGLLPDYDTRVVGLWSAISDAAHASPTFRTWFLFKRFTADW